MKNTQSLRSLTKIEKIALASVCGTTIGYINQIIYGKSIPSPSLALRIDIATGGKCSKRELRPDVDWNLVEAAAKAETMVCHGSQS